jgi:hypothetical protein
MLEDEFSRDNESKLDFLLIVSRTTFHQLNFHKQTKQEREEKSGEGEDWRWQWRRRSGEENEKN